MKWVILGIAGLFEVEWAIAMKYSNGFTVLLPTVLTVVGYIASVVFLALAMKQLSLGTTYAIWTGIGIVGTNLWGFFVMKDTMSPLQWACVAMICCGIVGLNLLSGE